MGQVGRIPDPLRPNLLNSSARGHPKYRISVLNKTSKTFRLFHHSLYATIVTLFSQTQTKNNENPSYSLFGRQLLLFVSSNFA